MDPFHLGRSLFVAAVVVDTKDVCDTLRRSVGGPPGWAAEPREGYREPATGGERRERAAWISDGFVREPRLLDAIDAGSLGGCCGCCGCSCKVEVCTLVWRDPGESSCRLNDSASISRLSAIAPSPPAPFRIFGADETPESCGACCSSTIRARPSTARRSCCRVVQRAVMSPCRRSASPFFVARSASDRSIIFSILLMLEAYVLNVSHGHSHWAAIYH